MKKTLDQYLTQTLEQLLKREWSSRHLGKYFACPSCGKRFSTKNTFGTHCQGCKLELAIAEKKKENERLKNQGCSVSGFYSGLPCREGWSSEG